MDVSITNVVRPVAVAVRVALVGEWADGILPLLAGKVTQMEQMFKRMGYVSAMRNDEANDERLVAMVCFCGRFVVFVLRN